MKPAGNNEIDLLLRRLGGRRSGDESVDGDPPVEPEPHLDADELNAYAENALPPAARARYTEHVADCARCRKIVAQLAMSAGIALPAAAPVSEKSGLSRFFANLFSPAVLRYAVPSLAAAVVLGIGLMMFRYNAKKSFVAMQERVASPAVNEPPTAASAAPQSESERQGVKSVNGQIANDSLSPSNGGNAALQAERKAPAQTADKNAKVAEEGRREDAAPARELQEARVVSNETATVGGAVPASKRTTSNYEPEEKREVAKLKKEAEIADQPVAANKDEDKQRKTDDASAARGAAKTHVAGSVDSLSGLTPGVAGRRARARDNKAPEDAEIRTVAGRRFHKEGAVWIDTAYDSSISPINVARGSEQFRALIADEPAIRTIAEQLDGEVIVVWKSRTYRIH
jgi:hypothetical protein